MISIPIKIVESAITKYSAEIDLFIADGKAKLELMKNDKLKRLSKLEKDYLNKLITDYEKIIKANTADLDSFKTNFNLPNSNKPKRQNKFKDDVLNAMGYSKIRSNFYPKYFHSIGLKTCVYCNSQLAVTIEKQTNKFIAKFQVDHYYPKSKYPCFSISFYNLYPVCASCNNSKSDKKIEFKLYANQIGVIKSDFEFILNKASQAKYILSRNVDDIKIGFISPSTPVDYDNYNETFGIIEIYNTQKDLAEELILKAEVYTQKYKESLVESFKNIFTSASITNRLIIGNYADVDEIHKRPMAKFTQDIAKQLKLIE